MEIRFPLILDGATGTELQKHGYAGDVSAEQWTLAHPDVIVRHPAWLRCRRQPGALHADLRRKPPEARRARHLQPARRTTTAASPRSRAKRRAARHGSRAISRRRACFSPRSVRHRSRIWSTSTPSRLPVSRKPGSTCIVIETMMTLSDARAAVLAVRSVSDKPIFVSFTCDESGTQPLGHGRDRRADRAAGHGHQRVRAQLLDRAGTDARAAAPPAGIRPRAADRKAQRRYAHHRRRQDRI